jgi:hypothetical protein
MNTSPPKLKCDRRGQSLAVVLTKTEKIELKEQRLREPDAYERVLVTVLVNNCHLVRIQTSDVTSRGAVEFQSLRTLNILCDAVRSA